MTRGGAGAYEHSVMRAALARFLRLWVVFAFSYAILIFLYDLAVRGYIDVSIGPRGRELLLIPLIETAVFWALTGAWRRSAPADAGAGDR